MKEITLGKACILKSGKFISASEIQEQPAEGLYPCYGGNGIRGYVSEYSHDGHFPLIGRQGALCGNVNYASGKFRATEHAVVVQPVEEIDTRWLYYKLIAMNLGQYATGAAQPGLAVNKLEQLPICIPSLAEQKQTAKAFDKIEALIALRKEQLAKLDELVKARFVEMFGNNTDSGMPLRDCCIDVRGGGTPSMQHPEYYGGNVPFIKSGDVRGDLVHSGTLWLTEKALSDTPAKFVPKGAVLVVNRSAALLREFRAAIAEQPVVINQDIKAFIPKSEYASEYLLWAIKIQTQYLLTRVTTVLTSHIDLKDLLELKIMPASCEEQALFTQFISETNKTKLTIQASLDKLEVMKKALMQEYFG